VRLTEQNARSFLRDYGHSQHAHKARARVAVRSYASRTAATRAFVHCLYRAIVRAIHRPRLRIPTAHSDSAQQLRNHPVLASGAPISADLRATQHADCVPDLQYRPNVLRRFELTRFEEAEKSPRRLHDFASRPKIDRLSSIS
jgi:hypothetical protein